MGWEVRVLTFGQKFASLNIPLSRHTNKAPKSAAAIRALRFGRAASPGLGGSGVRPDDRLAALGRARRLPRAIKIVGDQAWERCVRKGWIAPAISIDDFQRFPGDARVRWQKRARTRQIRAMDAVIVPSAYLKGLVTSWGIEPAKIHVIHNALSPPATTSQSKAALRLELGWPDPPTLITVARLQPWKGIDHLIAAVRELPDLRLIVVGDGPDRKRLEELAAPLGERAVFTGQLAAREAHRLMAAADGLALYSGYEGLSHTLLESLHLGTPVLASDKGGNGEIVRHGVNGLLVPHVDVRALRRGIQQLLDGSDVYAANSRKGLERFSLQTMAKDTDARLRSLL